MKVLVRISVACVSIVLVAGCTYGTSGGRVGETGLVQVAHSTSLPEPVSVDTTAVLRHFVIGPQDVLIVDVSGIDELTARELVVDAAGRISVPMAGTVDAA